MKKLILAASILVAVMMSSTTYAACSCVCVNNSKAWVCANSWDVPAGYCGGWCSGAVYEPEIKTPDVSVTDPMKDIREAFRESQSITAKL